MDPVPPAALPISLPTGVFLIISMFLVSLAFREMNKPDRAEARAGVKRMFRFAWLHVVVGTVINLALTSSTLPDFDMSAAGRARTLTLLMSSGLNALFPALLGLAGIFYLWFRLNKRE